MTTACQQLFTASGVFTTPPGFCGPVLIETVDGATGINRSMLGLAGPNSSYNLSMSPSIVAFSGSLTGSVITGTSLGNVTLTWWQGTAAYAVVANGNFSFVPSGPTAGKSPPGYTGPVLTWCSDLGDGYNNNTMFGVSPLSGSGNPVVITQVTTNSVYTNVFTVSKGWGMIVWWP